MPNGESKNWIRLLITLNGFRNRYGHWPTAISIEPHFFEELQDKLTPADFKKLQSKLKLIQDDINPFQCHDEMGNQFNYGEALADKKKDKHNPIEWLNIVPPDYFD